MCFSSTMENRPWADLPVDLLCEIADRLTTTLDVVIFGQVCPTWKAATYRNSYHPSKQFPWILLCEKEAKRPYFNSPVHTDPKTRCRKFLTFPGGGFDSFLKFPGREQLSFPLSVACGRRCVGSSAGWLLMLDINEHINMMSPFTRARVPLPPQSKLMFPSQPLHPSPTEKFKAYISKIILGIDNTGCIVVMAIAGVGKKLAIAWPREHKWTPIKCKWSPIADAIFHDGIIYAVSTKGTLVTCNTAGQAEKIASPPKYMVTKLHNWYILVSISGSLLLIARQYSRKEFTKRFAVFEFLRDEGQWLPVQDLGDQALFVGFNTSTSVKASGISAGCEANCIYFTDDCMKVYLADEIYGGGADAGRYSLTDGSLVLCKYVGESFFSPPIWYIPRQPYQKFK